MYRRDLGNSREFVLGDIRLSSSRARMISCARLANLAPRHRHSAHVARYVAEQYQQIVLESVDIGQPHWKNELWVTSSVTSQQHYNKHAYNCTLVRRSLIC